MLFKRRTQEPEVRTCLVCGKREGVVHIEGGYACRYCYPTTGVYDRPTVREILARQMKDPVLLQRVDLFTESSSYGDLRFDDRFKEFFKGPWPNYCIPILAYDEIAGYRVLIDGRPVAFNSIDGSRAVFRPMTEDALRKGAKDIDSIVLEVDSNRRNIRFLPYDIFGKRQRIADTREECLEAAIAVSQKLDSIVEANIAAGVKKQSDNNQSDKATDLTNKGGQR